MVMVWLTLRKGQCWVMHRKSYFMLLSCLGHLQTARFCHNSRSQTHFLELTRKSKSYHRIHGKFGLSSSMTSLHVVVSCTNLVFNIRFDFINIIKVCTCRGSTLEISLRWKWITFFYVNGRCGGRQWNHTQLQYQSDQSATNYRLLLT